MRLGEYLKKNPKFTILVAAMIVVFIVFIYFAFFVELPIVVSGKLSIENCSGIEEDVEVAWCILGNDGFTYFLTDENWNLINEVNTSYSLDYGKNIMVSGPVRSIVVDGEECFLIKIMEFTVV